MASIIDPESAQKLIQEYQNQNAAAGESALKTTEGKNLNGFVLSRESLEDLLSNPKVTGVSVSLAKHPDTAGTEGNVYTLVLTGAEPNPQAGSTPYVSSGNTYAQTPPCPPWCVGK